MSSVQGPSEKPVWRCPECLTVYNRKHPGQLFCTPRHRDTWNNRASIRGRVLTPLVIVARVTRDGTRGDKPTGRRAAAEAALLIQRWRDEDAAAGRMAHPEYLALRYRAGFDPL